MRRCSRRVAAVALLFGAQGAWAGGVRGTVVVTGRPPPAAAIPVTKDGPTCGREVEDEALLVSGDGRLANVVAVLKGAAAPPPVRATLGQDRCRFVPHVQAVPLESTLDIANGDPILHNVHGWAGHSTRFNVPTPVQGERIPTKLTRPGPVQVRCDVHGWMSAWVWVVDAPAAVSGRDGSFTISGVPGGSYTLLLWHERLGEQTLSVTVPPDGDARVEASFRLDAARGR